MSQIFSRTYTRDSAQRARDRAVDRSRILDRSILKTVSRLNERGSIRPVATSTAAFPAALRAQSLSRPQSRSYRDRSRSHSRFARPKSMYICTWEESIILVAVSSPVMLIVQRVEIQEVNKRK